MPNKQNSAKFAFFYMLSLVALIFMSTSVGTILFQIINKTIADPIGISSGRFTSGALRYGISALIISAPIYYFITREIFKNLFKGLLEKDSGVRRWLTYFILFVAAVVMIGWLIAALNNFLNGELTIKFILKALTSIVISAIIFTFYFYDIKREEVAGKKDKVVTLYFYSTLVIVLAVLVAGFFFVESPTVVRQKRHDQQIVQNFENIYNAVTAYYNNNDTIPQSLEDLVSDPSREYYIIQDYLKDPETEEMFQYEKLAADTYKICASFYLSNKDDSEDDYDEFLQEKWAHDSGEQCFERRVEKYKNDSSNIPKPVPVR